MTSPCGAMHPPSPGGSTLGKLFPAGTRLQEGMETVPNYIQSVSINLAPMTPTGSFSRDSTLKIHMCHISYAFDYYNIAQTIQTVHISSLVHIYMLIMARIRL
jgi:hypothetical protein